jgi:hypothetical protein
MKSGLIARVLAACLFYFAFLNASALAAPSNDNFASPTLLTGNVQFDASVYEGTIEPDEPRFLFFSSTEASSWWAWTPQVSGFAVITLPGSPRLIGYPWTLLVSTGATMQAISTSTVARLEIRPGANAGFPVTIGQTYRIGLFGEGHTNLTHRIQIINSNNIVILQQPQSQTVRPGGAALFHVVAPGVHPSNISWLYRGVPIPDAEGPTHYVRNVRGSVLGSYNAVLQHGNLSIISHSAVLLLDALDSPPLVKLSKGAGATNEFFIDLHGDPEAHYRIEAANNFWFWSHLSLPESGGLYVRPGGPMRIRADDLTGHSMLFFRAARAGIFKDECIVQLQRIHLAKETWKFETLRQDGMDTSASIPDINRFFGFGFPPRCPAGGEYAYNSIGTNPTCSIPGHSL